MELHADEPRMVWALDNLWQLVVGRHSGENEAGPLEGVAIMNIDLVAMAVTLADFVDAVDRTDDTVTVELRRIGAKAHRAAEVSTRGALLQALLAHPFRDHAHYGLGS